MPPLKRVRPKHRPHGGAHIPAEFALTQEAVQYLGALFNADEAALYLREECDVPDDYASQCVETLKAGVEAFARSIRWRRP